MSDHGDPRTGDPHDPFAGDPFAGDPNDPSGLTSELASLSALLGDPGLWDEPDPGLEDDIVAAIRAEVAADTPGPERIVASIEDRRDQRAEMPRADHPADGRWTSAEPTGGDPAGTTGDTGNTGDIVSLDDARRRRWVGPALGAAAALLLVAAVGIGALLLGIGATGPADHEVALAGTELAPDATALAEVSATPQGTRIVLDVSGLPPAPEGTYYEAWLRQSPEIGVSAGTFHLRGGDGSIELWSGVTVDDYPLITVTIQEEGAGAASSGRVVLKGTVEAG